MPLDLVYASPRHALIFARLLRRFALGPAGLLSTLLSYLLYPLEWHCTIFTWAFALPVARATAASAYSSSGFTGSVPSCSARLAALLRRPSLPLRTLPASTRRGTSASRRVACPTTGGFGLLETVVPGPLRPAAGQASCVT
eukprot:GHVT01060950.1.p2 GENE.GHVT01060950.1~~GHVT01060950.1.p2  ORF type:complete len:141 (-),score=19.13 GHVT01060950.1:1440-1862(-)